MALVTNDEPVYESTEQRKILDAHSLVDDADRIVLDNPEAFHPVGPAEDEGVGRTSAVIANPELQHEDVKKQLAKAGAAKGADDPKNAAANQPTGSGKATTSSGTEPGKSSNSDKK